MKRLNISTHIQYQLPKIFLIPVAMVPSIRFIRHSKCLSISTGESREVDKVFNERGLRFH